MIRDVHQSILELASAPEPIAGDRAGNHLCPTPGSSPAPHVYLGLDQDASRIAWARGFLEIGPDPGKAPATGTEGLPDWTRPDGVFDPGPPLSAVDRFINTQVRDHGVTHIFSEGVYIDEPRYVGERKNRLTQIMLAQVAGVIAKACFDARDPFGRSIYHRSFTAAEWRKDFIGVIPNHLDSQDERRDWYKAQAKARCDWRGWIYADEHEAEACGVLNAGLCANYPEYAQSWLPLYYTRSHS